MEKRTERILKSEDREKGCALPSPRHDITSARSHNLTAALAAQNRPAQDLAINNKSWTRKGITMSLHLPSELMDSGEGETIFFSCIPTYKPARLQ